MKLMTLAEAARLVQYTVPGGVQRRRLTELFVRGLAPKPIAKFGRRILVTKRQAFLLVRLIKVQRKYRYHRGYSRKYALWQIRKSAAHVAKQWI